MTDDGAYEVDVPDEPYCLYQWKQALEHRVGMSAPEIARRVDELQEYCDRAGITPAKLLWSWEERYDVTARRRPDATERPDKAVESFLIHNGVNVFGEIAVVTSFGRWR